MAGEGLCPHAVPDLVSVGAAQLAGVKNYYLWPTGIDTPIGYEIYLVPSFGRLN